MIQTVGKAYPYEGGVVIRTQKPPNDHLSDEVTVVWHDTRRISAKQRRKARALVAEIAEFSGYETGEDKQILHQQLKSMFLDRQREQGLEAEDFSLHDCDMRTAAEYITFLVEHCLAFDVPTKEPLWAMADDVERYVYMCAKLGICAVCRRHAGIHHTTKVGMGRNRRNIVHVGMRGISLCWGPNGHHMEVEIIGNEAFMTKYHLCDVVIDEEIAHVYRLRAAAEGGVPDAAEDPPEGADMP